MIKDYKALPGSIDFSKSESSLVPAIIQDVSTQKVLMQGFMNREALEQTVNSGRVTFFSRSKNRLWTKGEISGNFLQVTDILPDCDRDCLLILASPSGPVCHTGSDTCFNVKNESVYFLPRLEKIISDRIAHPSEDSYTASLIKKGINKIAQKVGEEAVEMIIEAKDDNNELFLNEAADLLFHYLVLLQAKGKNLSDVENVLKNRHVENKTEG